MSYYNRYIGLTNDEISVCPPFVKLTEKSSDKFVRYRKNKSRLDKISQEYYGSPYYGWLILMANPECGGLEWNIKDNEDIRVPYPLDDSLRDYKSKIKSALQYYG